jgi:hypothetical protein
VAATQSVELSEQLTGLEGHGHVRCLEQPASGRSSSYVGTRNTTVDGLANDGSHRHPSFPGHRGDAPMTLIVEQDLQTML